MVTCKASVPLCLQLYKMTREILSKPQVGYYKIVSHLPPTFHTLLATWQGIEFNTHLPAVSRCLQMVNAEQQDCSSL